MQLLKISLNRRKVVILSAVFLFTGLVFSCKKHESTLGKNVLDPNSLLSSGGVDTFSLTTYSFIEDSSRTDNQLYGIVGAMVDPKFGLMSSSVYTQFRLAGLVDYQSTDVFHIDSCVLALEYGGYFGVPNSQTFEVYQIADTIGVETPYFKFSSKPHATGNLIAGDFDAAILPDFVNSVIVGNDTLQPQLRLHLDTNWAQSLLTEARDGTGFDNNENFVAFFKGLHIKVANETPASGGAVYYFRMSDPNSKLTIYYHLNNDAEQSEFDMVLNSEGKYFNHVDIDNTGTEVGQTVADSILNNQQQFYAQANLLKGHVDVPFIKSLSKKSMIHDALLVLPVAYQTGGYYPPPSTIVVTYDVNGLTYGGVTAYDDDYKAYVVDVRQYLQAVVLGQIDNKGLNIYPSNMGGSAERVVFNGKNTFNKTKPKLILKYTDYN